MGDQLSASPGGYLGGFILAGILLPVAVSFVLDGIVLYLRGRGPVRLFLTAALTLILVGVFSIIWQTVLFAGSATQLSGAIEMILWFSIPAAALGFGVRMLALFLNPTTKAADQLAIEQRKARHDERVAAREAARDKARAGSGVTREA
jgi:hypothetical protein